eukprot:TRINITY_DN27641_c0_g1_i1.p1 TRINITY_DN27641_c0_g1~~TRINITY_DN27641_c0_g1_i1.p1  ORF type:complete len:409 (+),score=84.08 TRINITY_DN27641_c0_g1_i1:72-1229(+)
MGLCVGKPQDANKVVERERKNNSSSSSKGAEAIKRPPQPAEAQAEASLAEAAREELAERVASKVLARGSILDCFPNAARKASICGIGSDVQQKGFANKNQESSGFDPEGLKIGCTCKKGLKPESPNQDDFCVFRFDNTGIYGVFDGHGPYGHDISSFVQEALPRCFVRNDDFGQAPEKALVGAFTEAQRLCTQSQAEGHFDCMLSGTTATLAMHREGRLYVANVGDSRAVLAKSVGDTLRSEDLTVDHRPTCDAERKRIQALGGQVRRLEGDILHRVFVSGKLYPGLAMTRSIGDTVGATAGVTATPEVRELRVQRDWRFMLLCSDGVWEFINSEEAVKLINRYPPSEVQKATENLASEAWNRWIKEEGNLVDDITVICVWFNQD